MKQPDATQAYCVSGNAHGAKGEFARAVQDLTRAIALDPDFIESYTQRGFNRIRIGDYDGAIYMSLIVFIRQEHREGAGD